MTGPELVFQVPMSRFSFFYPSTPSSHPFSFPSCLSPFVDSYYYFPFKVPSLTWAQRLLSLVVSRSRTQLACPSARAAHLDTHPEPHKARPHATRFTRPIYTLTSILSIQLFVFLPSRYLTLDTLQPDPG